MKRRPFQNLGPHKRRNLALAAVFAFYAVYIGMGLYWNNLFTAIGTDYLAFWSAGYLANTEGYTYVYNIEAVRRVQAPLVPEPKDDSYIFTPVPVPIFPAFVFPFQALALLPAIWSLVIWTLINLLLLLLYLRFFAKAIAQKWQSGGWSPVIMMLSFPVWWTLVWGQTNFLLVVCLGEFLRRMVSGRPFRAGLWLAGLLLKPQTLVLILPALFLQGSWKTLGGFTAMTLLLIMASLGIGGMDAFWGLINLWRESAIGHGLPTNNPQEMVNWRMVGIRLSSLLGLKIGWGIALTGLALTVLAALSLWRRPIPPSSPQFGVALLGTMAATCAATWHSHPHMMTILVPPLLYLLYQRRLPAVLLDLWLFLMPALLLTGLALDLLGKFRIIPGLPPDALAATSLILAVGGLGLNLSFLFWVVRTIQRLRAENGLAIA